MKTLVIALLIAGFASPVLAQQAAPVPARPHAIAELPSEAKLTVMTPAWKDGGDIPFANTQYRDNTFPGLQWTKGPDRTRSYAVILQDTDINVRGAPVLHWVLYNIPASVTTLDPGMTPDAKPAGSSYGPNYKGPNGAYLGPRTPPGPKHHYHMQVFALDITLQADDNLTYDALVSQMKGHVIAAGEVVGLAEADVSASKP